MIQQLNPGVDPQILISGEKLKLTLSARRLGVLLLAAVLFSVLLVASAPAEKPKQPKLEARAWALIDARTGRVLDSHAAAMHLPIASTTKLMTAYVALQELPLDKIVHAARYDPIYGESLLNLRIGQRVSVRDLLYGLILRSGNDAAYDLARAAAGSEAAFVRQMNQRAAALGLADTHYANPIGLDQRGNYSSAADLATLDPAPASRARLRQDRRLDLGAISKSLHPPRRITTINELLYLAPWVNGVKTGPHLRRRLRPRRLRTAQGRRPDLGR